MGTDHKALRNLERAMTALPPVRALRKRAYEREFASSAGSGSFRGVFKTFDAAIRSAPSGVNVGFDVPEFAREFRDRLTRVLAYDYPVLFWLKSILGPTMRVFDYGGHVGIKLYAYQKYLPILRDLSWLVCDVPSVIDAGRELANRRGGVSERIGFTTDFGEADGFDVIIAGGVLQYVEAPSFGESLARLPKRPAHLLLNSLPLREGPWFVTLQNAGSTFVPQYVFDRREFIDDLVRAGYEVVDQWEDHVHSCRIPFHEDKDVPHYSGVYLRRAS